MSSRRDFLRSIPLISGSLALGITSKAAFAGVPLKKEAGIQLWSLRDEVKNDLEGTLEKLAEMGFTSLETYGFNGSFFDQEARSFSRFCSSLGLTIHSSHCGITSENASIYAEKAAEAGLEYLILPSMMGRPELTVDDFKRTAAEMNLIGEACQQQGIRFGYHNHNFEFRPIGDQLPYDILLNHTDKELVSFQLDLYWIVKAGFDPKTYFMNHPKRFQTWHLKDKGHDGESCIIGNGTLDFKTLLEWGETAGLDRIFYEQEQYSEGTPLFCAGQSLRYIQSHLF